MSSEELSMDEFLKHTTSGGSGRNNYLRKWKNDPPHNVDVALHTKAPIMASWKMAWPRLVTREKDGVEVTEVWGGDFNTWESADVCKDFYRRDRNTGERQSPPVICPFQLFLERVHDAIESGEISWTQPLFRFTPDDTNHTQTLRSGGMLGMYGRKGETKEQKKELSKAGIDLRNEWKNKSAPKCKYIFCVVRIDKPEDGVQIATETSLLGDMVRDKIGEECVALKSDIKGNPLIHPYVIRWQYVPKATEFNKKYKAIVMRNEVITDEVMELIKETDKPSTEHLTKRGNPVELRADMENFYIGPDGIFDWDEIFGPSEEVWAAEHGDDEPADDGEDAESADEVFDADKVEEEVAPDPEPEPVAKPKARKRKPKAAAKLDPMEVLRNRVLATEDQASCSECDKIIHNDDDVCPFCMFDYTADDEEVAPTPPPKPAPKRRRRAATKAEPVEAAGSDDDPGGDDIGF